jgi:hypothetical protein
MSAFIRETLSKIGGAFLQKDERVTLTEEDFVRYHTLHEMLHACADKVGVEETLWWVAEWKDLRYLEETYKK